MTAACGPTAAARQASLSAQDREASPPIARRTGFATAADGTKIYWEACGQGPGLVLVHGLGGNHAVWFRQVAHFARSRTVLTLAQRGFSPSGSHDGPFDAGLLAADVESVMQAAGLGRAVVVGQSMGGWTALALALRRPELVEALVLADSPGGIDDESLRAHMRKVTEAAARLSNEPPPLGVHPSLAPAFSRDHADLAYLYQTLATFGSPSPRRIAGELASSLVGPRALATLSLPVLFVVGSQDGIFPPDIVRRAASHVPGASVVEIEGAGHSPYFETPGRWNEAVEGFLGRLAPRGG